MKADASRHDPRSSGFPIRCWAVSILASGLFFQAPTALVASESKLSEAVEQASKPIEEQEFLERESVDDCCTDDEGNWFINLLFSIFFNGSDSEPEFEDEAETLRERASAPKRSHREWSLGLTTLHLQPQDNVVSSLRGGGLEVTGRLSRRFHLEGGAHLLRADLPPGSVAHFALRGPWEVGLLARGRTYLLPSHGLGLNAFVGLRFGVLHWDYRNSVFAVDPYGYGDEIWRDSIVNFAPFWGIGVRPALGQHVSLGVDVGTGWRSYNDKTFEKFHNDMFKDNWYWQGSLKLAFRF